MVPLRIHERDQELAEQLGDQGLRLPGCEEIHLLVQRDLLMNQDLSVATVQLTYARWKPGVSLLGMWELCLSSGSRHIVSLKVHRDPAQVKAASYARVNEHVADLAEPLKPFVLLEESAAMLVAFPADRSLRGLARVMNLRKTARVLDETELWRPFVMRRRSSRLELLRYKPERRAVFQLTANLKQRGARAESAKGQQDPAPFQLAVRVLPLQECKSVVARRSQLKTNIGPRLLHTELETGAIFEEWLVGSTRSPEDFTHARSAGAALAQLHASPAQGRLVARDRTDLLALAARIPDPRPWLADIPVVPSLNCTHLIHGDFHPDQCIETADGMRLLDLDEVRPGVAEEDLANWIADALNEDPGAELCEVAAPLLAGYRESGYVVRTKILRGFIAEELVARAMAGLRRLELGAVEMARTLIERARSVAGERIDS